MRRSLLSWVAVAALVAVAVATAGWGSHPRAGPDQRRPPARGLATPLSMREAAALVRSLDLERRDLPVGFRAVTARDGTDLDAGDRLELCGAAVPSTAFRLAAHRGAFLASGGRRVRTEIVAYRSGHIEPALAELRATAPRCTHAVSPDGVEQPSTLALDVRSAAPGAVRRELLVQRRGDVLTLLEVDQATGPLPLALSRVLGAHLLWRLPAA